MAASVQTIMDWLKANAPQAQLSSDSRSIAPGDVFVAYPVIGADGRKHIEHAIAQGAAAVLYESEGYTWNDAWAVPHLAVEKLDR
ncbi:MAG: UDP-N-acetylmuramoyl-L-alanyl-D-glutamate--2,6-diaminopimelate ligase, partial [Burkholderiaceae bacterium]|nr:UDP-N-acetylmuramoyl-L-alanyl-D-glutamate--2,6-diaminopimelate ligase [Burkholderiaceae bacterium]